MYGPLDVVALTGEKVDIYVRKSSVCFMMDKNTSSSNTSTASMSSVPAEVRESLFRR